MDELKDFLKEDGYLSVADCSEIHKIIFHPNLNIILIFTKDLLLVLDVNSGVVLQRVAIADVNRIVKGKYLTEHDKILFWDGENLGLRGDYNGVLLLETILQTPTTQADDPIKVEILLSEAVLLLQSLQSLEQQGIENSTDVINELTLKITEAHLRAKKGIKAQKWETICLELPHSSLKVVCSYMVLELKRLQRHIPALAIASSVNERLTDLIVGGRIIESEQTQRFHMFSEAARRKTFDSWPHMDYKWALPDQMAQAGFYHQPSESGDDRAMCFTCSVCLVCWEKTDEPWSEHERHSPECPFVKGEYTQNVPLSVTHSTSPASSTDSFTIISSGDTGNIICIGNNDTGDVGIWNVERQLKKSASFNIKSSEKDILKKFDVEDDLNIKLTALCTFKKQTVPKMKDIGMEKNRVGVIGTRIIAGVKCRWNDTGTVNRQTFDNEKRSGDNKALLVLYAVTEPPKTSSKASMSTANGNMSNPEDLCYTSKSGSSLITILESYEERLDDDFLKFFDTEKIPSSFNIANDKLGILQNSGPKDLWCSPKSPDKKSDFMDSAKSLPSTGSSPASFQQTQLAPKSEHDVICIPVQIVPIPACLFKDYEIREILPSFDNRFLLIVLKRSQEKSDDEIVFMETDQNDAYSPESYPFVHLLLYGIDDNGFIKEVPISQRLLEPKDTPIEICMLPKFDTSGRLFSGSPTESGAFVMTCVDGSIKVLSLTSLKTLSEAKVEGQKFTSSVYCKNLERLCGCTDKGSLHFYSFYDLDIDSSDEFDDEAAGPIVIDSASSTDKNDGFVQFDNATPSTSTSFSKASASSDDKRHNPELIAHRKELTLKDLRTLHSLTFFDEMLTPYSAEVPGCWAELVQAQKQRRHPQHLRPGEDTHLTRTWRLHNDASTWDEHLIEISLPKTTSLGHIDFKFALYQPCTNPPAIQVTLLKQKSIGLCCRRKTQAKTLPSNAGSNEANTFDVDENINFNLNGNSGMGGNIGGSGQFNTVENPVLSEEYLQARNAEILAGPIELSSCMDLNEQGGVVTLVSPKLLKSKARNYLLHIKTMADVSKEGHGKTRVPVRKKGITSVLLTSFANKEPTKERVTYVQDTSSKAKANNTRDFYIGCDWLHEISISVRATQEVPNINSERLQRSAMLESNTLLKSLLTFASNKEDVLQQTLALDILVWIISIRMARYRCPRNCSTDVNVQQSICVQLIGEALGELINKSILLNNRSIAHRCVKLVTVAMIGAQNMMDQKQHYLFEMSLKQALVDSVPDMVKSNYAGALRWFSLLISGTSNADSQGVISTALVKLLIEVLNEISERPNALNSVLQARFGLYGMPFESECFDAEMPSLSRGNNLAFSYAAAIKQTNGSQQNQFGDLKNFCVTNGPELRIPIQLRRKSVSLNFKGLLEVEPLHYTCCATSEATRIENMDSLSMQSSNLIDDMLIETPPQSQNGVITLLPTLNKMPPTNVIKMPTMVENPYEIIIETKLSQEEMLKNGGTKTTKIEKFDMGSANVKTIFDKIFNTKPFQAKTKVDTKTTGAIAAAVDAAAAADVTADATASAPAGDNKQIFTNVEAEFLLDQESEDKDVSKEVLDNTKANAASSSVFTAKVKDFIEETNNEDNESFILPWHKLLSTPAKQMIVVDRMHSGARRQVTLDFGYAVLLTDLIIPSCADLATLTIDVWCFDEESDSVRLAVSQDIMVKALILSDLQPSPVCRYMRITFTGRYGMSATRCKVPMGSFYGHVVVLDKEAYADPVMGNMKNNISHIKTQLKVLNALHEDTHTRYCLSSSKLCDLLQPLLRSDNSNMAHMQSYLNRMKETDEQNAEYNKICEIYEECMAFQNQLNIVKNVIKRLESAAVGDQKQSQVKVPLKSICTDKLRVLSECLVESLLHFIITYGVQNVTTLHTFFDLKTCNLLFKTLVIRGDSHIRLATCSLLVRMCCFQPWWGDFFANTFTTLFSSQNCETFPQDRVFFLLTYLGRKSIYMGACRTIVIDAVLKTIATLLAPLSTNFDNRLGVWRNTDLVLLSWLLLFLSVCLDENSEKKESVSPRWDFMSGEADMVKARLSLTNGSRPFSRSFKKRFLQNKQSSSNNNIAEKFYMMSEQFANAQSINTAQPGGSTAMQTSMLDSVLKNQENNMKKFQNSINMLPFSDYLFGKHLMKKTSDTKAGSGLPSTNAMNINAGSSSSVPTSKGIRTELLIDMNESAFDKGLKSIKTQNMIVVIRGLIGLLLNMDFTCNMDLFLLTCKIIARLVNACKMSVQLSSIMTTQQLLQLIRISVWENQQHPWTVHAITCLLQDILEADRNFKSMNMPCDGDSEQMDIDCMGSLNDFDLSPMSEMHNVMQSSSNLHQLQNQQNNIAAKELSYAEVKYQLPSLIECDDTEMEDILDNILEQSKKMTSSKKEGGPPTPPTRTGITTVYRSRVSATMDARLDCGLDVNTEVFLRRLTMKTSINLYASLPQFENKETLHVQAEVPAWNDEILNAWNSSEYQQLDTNIMLMDVFENVFSDLHLEDSWLNLEQVLQLWLTLNGDNLESVKYCTNMPPKIPFGEKAVYGLLKALSSHPTIKIRGWCLGFQCLIYACKPTVDVETDFMQSLYGNHENYTKKIGALIINNDNFERMLLRFFSGTYKSNSLNSNRYAGPTICRLIMEMFSYLQNKCNAKEKLKEILMRVLLQLIQYDGAISKQQGPIDAQSQLIKELLKYQYQKTDLCVAMSIVESISHLIYNHMTNVEKIQCQKSSESNGSQTNVFGSLFATVLGSESAQSKTVTDTTLLMNLLRLATIMVHTKLPPTAEETNEAQGVASASECQTDETKAEQQQTDAPLVTPRVQRPQPSFADTVLQHFPTMNKLVGALSHCTDSSVTMLVISSVYTPAYNDTKNALGDPHSVGDALFQLLIYMNKLASEQVLIIKPLYDFLNYVSSIRHAMPKHQLSEPFLWFILKMLDSPAAVEVFCEMGGIKILADNLVRSNRTLINKQPNLVTMIMQHLSKTQTIHSSLQAARKAPNSKYDEGLINFAPYCTITSENPSAQPAEVLIQGPVASHRRARTPAWSYLFYPHESHVDLTLVLPVAVLLKEIQLQPHLSTLASCPSAVAIEITRDGNFSPIPITQPISTVGMTCIRLKLTQPEIATHIVIRLYRPKDSSNIGLTQISVLGTTIFFDVSNNRSGNNNDMLIEDDSQTETSLGWLRILAQCFNVATFNVDHNLSNMVISSASEVNGFLEACCSLLNIAPSITNFLLQNLETVLLKLGLHSRELGLRLIDVLLNDSIPQIFKLCNESISDLLYQLCTTSDQFSRDRIQMMVTWMINLQPRIIFGQQQQIVNPNSGYIKCLASILWQAYATNLILDLPTMITPELFEILFKWIQEIPENSPMKTAIDSMLCSVCCIRPEFFTLLLRKMQVLVPNRSSDLTACISDDRKDNESMTDDNKQHEFNTEEWYCHYSIESLSKLHLSTSQLQTIAMACQSPLAIYQLIDSGLPNLFTSAILEFCHRMSNRENQQQSECLTDADKVNITGYSMVNVIKITEILDFMAQICTEGHMRDWLGSYEGSVFWEPLLTLLCNNKLQHSYMNDETTNQPYLELEETVIKFLSNVTSCHPKNQDTLTTNLISVIRTTERNNYNININNVLNKNGNASGYCPLSMKYSISGFTRRLVLQILLESEKIAISVRSDLPLLRKDNNMVFISNHPSKKPNSHHMLFYTSINARCQDILENSISVYNNVQPTINTGEHNRSSDSASNSASNSDNARDKAKDLWELGLNMNLGMEFLSVAAGVTAKDKRSKDVKNQANSMKTKDLFNIFKIRPDDPMKNMQNLTESSQLVHPACPDIIVTSDTTISQILTMIKSAGLSLSTPCINLSLVQSKTIDDVNCDTTMKASDFVPLPSPLQIFSSRGGLSLLAHYLPTVYPEQPKGQQKLSEKDKNQAVGEWVKGEWVKIEQNEEIYEDVDDSLLESSTKIPVVTSVPQHSLAAFGLFLKLPAYSEVLLRDKIRAQCLLRLILGVTGDGEGNDIYSLALSSSLPTLPFEVLRQLLDSSPLTTDDGVLLRRMIIEVGAVNLVLNCLSIFTHHNSSVSIPAPELPKPPMKTASIGEEQLISDDKSHVYWAKGTGFGTGSTQQSWNVEQALLRQKSEEEHVTVLLQVLSSYINPGDIISSSCDEDNINYRDPNENISDLPPLFLDLLQQSCLIPALCSYLRNDSVLDITRHIPLYRAILQLLRALSISTQLVQLLITKQDRDSKTSISSLLYNMKSCVDTYASRLKINKKSNLKGQTQKISISLDESDDEGLALLIPDIQETTVLVQSATYSETANKEENQQSMSSLEYQIGHSIEQKYLEVMKKLQFDTFEMIVESENNYRFTISHHFESNVRTSGDRGHPARVKRLAQEAVTLSTSLPLSYSSSVFVRCDTDRLDIMKVLITGPADTPYANGCFEFDVYFPHDYPNAPMMINLETTGRHLVRFNPNLYNDGKVCLSVLNTWHGRPEEKWNAQTSSFLQVLVSIQSLILVPEPYFNEPGFERSRGTPSGTHSSREYNSNIYQASVKWAMLEQLKNPCPCFKDVIYTHFWLKRNEICTQIENWIAELSLPQYSERSGRTISFNSMVLRRQYRQIREELAKLPVPEGLEAFDHPFSANVTSTNPPPPIPIASPTVPTTSTQQSATVGQMAASLANIMNSKGIGGGTGITVKPFKFPKEFEDAIEAKSQNMATYDDILNFSDSSFDNIIENAMKEADDDGVDEKMMTDDMGSE